MIAYDFGTFVMFSIFEFVILVFLKHCIFRGFWSNSRRNHANQKIKNNWIIVKIQETRIMIQEASEDLQMGGILFPKYWCKLFEGLGHDLASHVPSAFTMRLGHETCFTLMCLRLFLYAPCMQKLEAQLSFPASVLGKARTFSPKPGTNSHYKY